ncbi:MAG: RNA polymerase sigma factor [Bacteroidales bacterium]
MQDLISQEIINDCRLHDRKAQRLVYERLFSSSMRVCKRYCKNQEEAMEVLNSGFLKVFTQIDKFSGNGSFEGWIYRIMVNTAMDHIRSEKKFRDHLSVSDDLENLAEEETVDEQDFNNLDLDTLYLMINGLPPASRMVFNLYVFDGFSHDDIGRELGISAGTSKWHLSNARKLLQNSIKSVYQKVQQ